MWTFTLLRAVSSRQSQFRLSSTRAPEATLTFPFQLWCAPGLHLRLLSAHCNRLLIDCLTQSMHRHEMDSTRQQQATCLVTCPDLPVNVSSLPNVILLMCTAHDFWVSRIISCPPCSVCEYTGEARHHLMSLAATPHTACNNAQSSLWPQLGAFQLTINCIL